MNCKLIRTHYKHQTTNETYLITFNKKINIGITNNTSDNQCNKQHTNQTTNPYNYIKKYSM